MNAPRYPAVLTPTHWERQAGALAKAKPAPLVDELKALERQFDTLDFTLGDASKLASVPEAEQRAARLAGEFDKGLRALTDLTRAVETAVGKLDAQFRKDPAARAALQAAAAVARAATGQRGELGKFLDAARAAVDKRLAELKEEASKAEKAQKPKTDSPERLRLKTRVTDQFRIVKNRPDRKVLFLLCVGRETAAPYLGPSISDSKKPELTKALKGDTGFKFYRGECIWEDGGYTFVGRNLSSTLARRIERGIMDLTGTRYRVRARE